MDCKNCIWFDKCGCETACEYYETETLDEASSRMEYIKDLYERDILYKQQIEEQNS